MNETLALLSEKLRASDLKLKTAESFTGGGLAAKIISVPGASSYFFEGIVCYSPISKTLRLGVPTELIDKYGVVSKEVAESMVKGLLNSGNCDIAAATTGNAGPDADDKGVGTCYLAVGSKNGIWVSEKRYSGDRGMITEKAVDDCIGMLYNIILKDGKKE